MKRMLALTAAALLVSAPFSFAQPTQTPPPTAQQPTQPGEPGAQRANPNPGAMQQPAEPTPPGATTRQTVPGTSGDPPPVPGPGATETAPGVARAPGLSEEGSPYCRTVRQDGERCSCLKAPSRYGVSRRDDNANRNMCMVPGV